MVNSAVKEWDGITDFQLYLFGEGTNTKAYEMLGAHKTENGWRFSVWAPNAKQVWLEGSFNGWSTEKDKMNLIEKTGVWTYVCDSAAEGDFYKYAIVDKEGKIHHKADPYGFACELRPNTASVIKDIDCYKWRDKKWISEREKRTPYDRPMLIYEAHLGSWKRHEDGSFYTYRESAQSLIPYLKKMNYTHLELMPISEHPYDGSWGYQTTGYYAATSRYGSCEDLMYFIEECHKNGIAVIMDWVPAHFPRDEHGLRQFDGMCEYEYADPKIGEHKEWGTLVFDYGKKEVLSFLISNAHFWFDKYHIDGLRVDAVSSMLYRDYNRKDGEWIANKDGGNENYEAIAFLQNLNSSVFKEYPFALMIAEESTAWPMITKPVCDGGLGFNYKWNMGWMNDTLRYMSMDPYFRKYNHNILTFLMYYAFSENYILPLSHDEVVHGKKSLIDKMYGTYEEKFAQLKLYYSYMIAHPGKKLLFMGGEFGQFVEWRPAEGLDWILFDYETHRDLHEFVRFLNKTYIKEKAFWKIENSWDGFTWINPDDCDNSVLSFMRSSASKSDNIICVFNFTPVCREEYIIGVPAYGEYEVILASNDKSYGGDGVYKKTVKAKKTPWNNMPYSVNLKLGAFSALYLKKKSARKKAATIKN